MRQKLAERFDNNRSIESNNSNHEMDTAINQLTEQLKVVVEQVQKMTLKSEEYERSLTFLHQKATEERTEVQIPEQPQIAFDVFKIPDPIKSIPEYDGNRKQLNAWLQTAEETLNVFKPLAGELQFRLYLQAVSNKIKGKAKDALCLAGNPQSFEEIKAILLETLGDKQELTFYKSQLWATKQNEGMTIHSYFNKIKENIQNVKTLAKQNNVYNQAWPAISMFIEEDALAAFISGLRKPYFGYAQAAKPKNIEEAYAFLCKFNSNEIISENARKIRIGNQTPNKLFPPFQKQKEWNPYTQTQNKVVPSKDEDVSMRTRNMGGRNKPIPMEVDTSMRSRNTFNRNYSNGNQVNTHELHKDDEEREVVNTDEDPITEFEVNSSNFQADPESDTED